MQAGPSYSHPVYTAKPPIGGLEAASKRIRTSIHRIHLSCPATFLFLMADGSFGPPFCG